MRNDNGYRFSEGDLIVADMKPLTEFAGFARVLEADRKEGYFRFDFYTKYGQVHYDDRYRKKLPLHEFETRGYYRLMTEDEMETFRKGLASCRHGRDTMTDETFTYVTDVLERIREGQER